MPRLELSPRLKELGFSPLPAAREHAPALVAPNSMQQAADLLGTCSREGWRVRLCGAGSRSPGLLGGTAPAPGMSGAGAGTRPDLLVTAQALVGLDVYVPDDLTVGVLAGTSHQQLDQELARQGQLLALDPPLPEAGTLGGTMALAAAGPLRAGYGTPRDFALGIHAVTADGRILRLGGQVVKNVAGYDLVRLLVGSRGTLALITQVHVRLRALPAADATIVAPLRDAAHAGDMALRLRDALHPVALELLGPRGADPWRAALRFHGSAAVMDEAERRTRALLPDAVRLTPDTAAAFWTGMRRAEGGAGTRIRLAAQPSELPQLLALAGRIAAEPAGEWLQLAHGADGIVRLCHPARMPGGAARLEALLPALAADAARFGGTCICETGPASLRSAAPPPTPAAAVVRLEAELRRQFDPAAILVSD